MSALSRKFRQSKKASRSKSKISLPIPLRWLSVSRWTFPRLSVRVHAWTKRRHSTQMGSLCTCCSAAVFSQQYVAEPSRICVYSFPWNEWVLGKTVRGFGSQVRFSGMLGIFLQTLRGYLVLRRSVPWLSLTSFIFNQAPFRSLRFSNFQAYHK